MTPLSGGTVFSSVIWITVKHVHNNHPRDSKFVAVVDRWSFFRGSFVGKWDPKIVVVVGRWSYSEVVVSSGLIIFINFVMLWDFGMVFKTFVSDSY